MNRIATFLDKKGWSVYKLAKDAGHPHHRTKQIVGGDNIPANARLSTLRKIAKVFNTSVDELVGDLPEGTIKIIIPGEIPPTWNSFYSGKMQYWKRSGLAADIHQIVRGTD